MLDGSSLWCGHGHKIEAIESCAEGAMVWFGMVAKRIAMIRYGDEANSDGMVLSGRVQSSDSKVQYCEGMVQCRAAVVLLC